MNRTVLNFDIKDTEKELVIWDCSRYNPDVPITNPLISFTPPNFTQAHTTVFEPKQRLMFGAQELGWGNTTLGDGVYTLVFSVCPNEEIFIKINYLRFWNLRKKILTFANKCEGLEDLLYLEVAKSLTNSTDKQETEKGILIFNQLNSKYGVC